MVWPSLQWGGCWLYIELSRETLTQVGGLHQVVGAWACHFFISAVPHSLPISAWGQQAANRSAVQSPACTQGPPCCSTVALPPPAAKHPAVFRMDSNKAHFLPPSL